MSKKFKSGLESLFDNAEREFQEDRFALAEREKAEKAGERKKPTAKTAKKGGGRARLGKNFTADLDSLFDLAVEEKQAPRRPASASNKVATGNKLRERKPLSGLDALIRQTTEMDGDGPALKPTKRVTFSYNRKKLDRLKRIARERRLYLKDIMAEIVNDYLKRYPDAER